MVTFEPSGLAALDATPAIALEDGPPDRGPAAGMQVSVVSAHLYRRSCDMLGCERSSGRSPTIAPSSPKLLGRITTVPDPYLSFRPRATQQRTIDTLIGISKGMIADGVVTQGEAEALLSWLVVNQKTVAANPVTDGLVERVKEMLVDDILDADESSELHDLLTQISGGIEGAGELFKPTTLPLDQPPPPVVFGDRSFLFTGTFIFGNRRACETTVREKGGAIEKSVNLSLDYLVIGSYVTDSWKHQSFGNKIIKAMEYRDSNNPSLAIVSEDHWTAEGGF